MIIKSIVKRTLIAVGVIGALSLAAIPEVSARVHGAGLGRAVFAADQSCFSLFVNGVTNTCGTARLFEVPLPADAQGTKNVIVSGNSATCQAHGSNVGITMSTSGSSVTLAAGAAPDIKTSTGVVLPAGGRIWLTCNVQPNGRVLNIDFPH